MKRKFIIDTDCGLDDAMAIMMAITQPNVEVLAITCVNGNTCVDNVIVNVFRTLQSCNQLQIPVYKGTGAPIMGKYTFDKPCDFHGSDGFGDVCEPLKCSKIVEKEHAVHILASLIDKYPGEITLVTLGPLTNIALALRLNPSFASNIKEMFVMGGNTEGRGNVTVSAEANFYYDPEAAYIVLNEIQCPITIAPWEMCLKHHMSWEDREKLLSPNTKAANLISLIEHNVKKKSTEYEGYVLCDQFAMAAAISEKSVKSKIGPYHVSCEPQGHYTRGQMIIFLSHESRQNVHIIEYMDMHEVKKLLQIAMNF
uniref:Inosine/uridine-preferring nucleoside hydrolase domain-containing protein n=1 Tax=Strigamia maritima TaxID=126957 RepID=T1JI57_STRMM